MAGDETKAATRGDARTLRTAQEVDKHNVQVWDMVQHLVNPVFLYVIAQILIVSRWTGHPAFESLGPVTFILQFLGAWALFYSTLLRDMGFRSLAGPILGALAVGGVIAQYLIFPDPLAAADRSVRIFLAIQLVPAAVLWISTFRRWRALKREFGDESEVAS